MPSVAFLRRSIPLFFLFMATKTPPDKGGVYLR